MPAKQSSSCVDTVINRCFGILIGLNHARHIIPLSILPRIADSLVLSHLRYCASVYGGASRTNIAMLQKVLNFSARVISGRRKYDHVSDVIDNLAWLRAPEMISYFDLSLIHGILTYGKPDLLRSWFMYNHEHVCRDTRQSHHLSLPRVRNNHGKRRFVYRAAEAYNRLAITNCHSGLSMPTFKARIRDLLSTRLLRASAKREASFY